MRAVWLEQKKLSPEQKSHIANTILPRISPTELEPLFTCIESAWAQDALYQLDNDLTPSELEKELRRTIGNLDKAISKVQFLDKHNETHIIDRYFSIKANLNLHEFFANSNPTESITNKFLGRIRSSIHEYAEDVREARGADAGETRGKHYKIEHWALLRDLIQFFDRHIPGTTPSASENTPFYNLVNYLFSEVMGFETKDARRQIKNALQIVRTGTAPTKNPK